MPKGSSRETQNAAAIFARIMTAGPTRQPDTELRSLLRGERGDAPSTKQKCTTEERSSLSRSDQVVGLAILACLAIFGLFSIGQFLQDILGR